MVHFHRYADHCHASPCRSDAGLFAPFRSLADACLRFASPLPSHAEQCRFDTSPCKAPAVRYHSEQCDSFAVPCRAVPRHCLSFDALPQQIISQPRDAIALQFRGDSWQVSALALPHPAPLNFAVAGRCYAVANPALLMAIWYQILTQTNQQIRLPTVHAIVCSCFHDHCLGRQSTTLRSYTISTSVCLPAVSVYPTVPFHGSYCPKKHFPTFQKNVPFPAMPLLHGSALCPRCPARCFALANPGQSLPLPGYESVTIVILKNTEVKSKWIRKRKFGVLHKRRGFVLCVSHK